MVDSLTSRPKISLNSKSWRGDLLSLSDSIQVLLFIIFEYSFIRSCNIICKHTNKLVRTRDAVSNLHRGGIDFAMEIYENEDKPRYLSFLEVLTEFSTKLIKQDRTGLLRYLEARLPEGRKPQTKDEYWIPYMTYRNTLQTNNPDKRQPPHRAAQRNIMQPKPQPQRQRHLSTSSVNSQVNF